MKINEIIKTKRLEKKLTQEQVATYLGVSTPAVNKWEKGTTYPDITLLPTLARLLGTDLNTLLAFKDNLSSYEVGMFLNTLDKINDYQEIFEKALLKISEFPNCDELIYYVATFLGGVVAQNNTKIKDINYYTSKIEELYLRVAEGENGYLSQHAKAMLVSNYIQSKQYQKAETLLNSLPNQDHIDKARLEAKLYIEYGKLSEASRIEEQRLLSKLNEIQAILLSLENIAIKDERISDAEYIADVYKQSIEVFDGWQYMTYLGHIQLYSETKQHLKLIKNVMLMLKAIKLPWEMQASPLYRHIEPKKIEDNFGSEMQKKMVHSILEDEDLAVVKQSPEFNKLAKDILNDK